MKNLQLLIQNQRKGDFASEISDKLAEVSKAAIETGKPGTVTIKIKVKPMQGLEAVAIEDKVTATIPEGDPTRAVFYINDDGDLERNDPKQRELPLQTIEGGKKDEPIAKAI